MVEINPVFQMPYYYYTLHNTESTHIILYFMIIFKQKYEFDILINFYVCPIMYGCGGTQQNPIQSSESNKQ